ncbi:MAG: hypothetical protein KGV51_03435 [Moraxellaceae bacterium]|nr:hypothetical protein [Moraxellaceae bacterium]
MRRKYALILPPLTFPKAMQLAKKGQFVSTVNMAKYLGATHIETDCNAVAIRCEIKQLTIGQLLELYNEFNCDDFNLTMQDSIIQSNEPTDFGGQLLDKFGYALTLRFMQGRDLFDVLKSLLIEIKETNNGR